MFKEKQFENKIFNGIIALCASLLTNMLTNFISVTNYTAIKVDEKIIIKNVPLTLSILVLNIIKIIGIFCIFFILLKFITKIITKLVKKFRTRKIEKIDEKELNDILYLTKQDILTLYRFFSPNTPSPTRDSFIKINLKELHTIILRLNKYFSKPNNNEGNKLKKLLRKSSSSSYITSSNGISYYELEGIFDLLQFMLNETLTLSSTDPLLISDCKKMFDLLQQLRESLFSEKQD